MVLYDTHKSCTVPFIKVSSHTRFGTIFSFDAHSSQISESCMYRLNVGCSCRMFRHAKGLKGVSRKELKRETGSRGMYLGVQELAGEWRFVAGNNTGKWTGGNSRATPAASSATSATGDSVPSCVYRWFYGCFHPLRRVCFMMPVGEVPAVCEGVWQHVYVCVSTRERGWLRRGVRGLLTMVVTPTTSSISGSIIMRGLRIVASGY